MENKRQTLYMRTCMHFCAHSGPGVDSASNTNEYQESSWGVKERQPRMADNLTVICEPIVYKMWEPQRLTALWASTACYRDSFTFFSLFPYSVSSFNLLFPI
jgi:hypothetical protein